ncbi:hypothetical protein V8G54_035916 [Vigna mungo]|uniref:Uncharacterized protein n=1 Tax=Vigna mungo TaxID=3915 RepID=A0AAQ3RF37_VIGMU
MELTPISLASSLTKARLVFLWVAIQTSPRLTLCPHSLSYENEQMHIKYVINIMRNRKLTNNITSPFLPSSLQCSLTPLCEQEFALSYCVYFLGQSPNIRIKKLLNYIRISRKEI